MLPFLRRRNTYVSIQPENNTPAKEQELGEPDTISDKTDAIKLSDGPGFICNGNRYDISVPPEILSRIGVAGESCGVLTHAIVGNGEKTATYIDFNKIVESCDEITHDWALEQLKMIDPRIRVIADTKFLRCGYKILITFIVNGRWISMRIYTTRLDRSYLYLLEDIIAAYADIPGAIQCFYGNYLEANMSLGQYLKCNLEDPRFAEVINNRYLVCQRLSGYRPLDSVAAPPLWLRKTFAKYIMMAHPVKGSNSIRSINVNYE